MGKREAHRALARFVADVETGRYVPKRQRQEPAVEAPEEQPEGRDHTLGALLDAWLGPCEARGREATTLRG